MWSGGKSPRDSNGVRKALLLALLAGATAHATVVFSEDFDDFGNLTVTGWILQNNSVSPGNDWFADSPLPIPGLSDSSISADFSSTTSTTGANISNWILTPQLSFDN